MDIQKIQGNESDYYNSGQIIIPINTTPVIYGEECCMKEKTISKYKIPQFNRNGKVIGRKGKTYL
jgi:hypothetical protein